MQKDSPTKLKICNSRNENIVPDVDVALATERALFFLKPKVTMYWLSFVLIVVITLFFIFGVILPVFETRDFGSVWPESNKRIGRKISFFFMAWVWVLSLPFWLIPGLRKGTCYFYEERLEIEPFFCRSKIVLFYKDILATVHGRYRLTISACHLPSWHTPIKRLNIRYWKGVTFGLLPHGLENPENVEKVLQVLRNKAASFKTKSWS